MSFEQRYTTVAFIYVLVLLLFGEVQTSLMNGDVGWAVRREKWALCSWNKLLLQYL